MKNHVARLLAADHASRLLQFVRHVAVSHRRHHHVDAPGAKRFHQAEVRHHRHHDHISRQAVILF